MSSRQITLAIIGAGARGNVYARFALEHPEQAKIIAIAEPRQEWRERMACEHKIDPSRVFTDWKELAAQPRMADAVIITTNDRMHADPAVAFADLKYDILLEKPMAPTESECRRIVQAVKRNGVIFAVCHVLRYAPYTRALKAMIQSGIIGDIASVDHLEPVGYWHMAHSFVRGNWRNSQESSCMLLAKSCHDIDWLAYIINKRCLSVASFGSLGHFNQQHKPPQAGNAKRCLNCDFESQCPYSAKKIYIRERFEHQDFGWPLNVLTADPRNKEKVMQALADGPYGRCVYECDNDVVDRQTVMLEYEGGVVATFTMTAFTEMSERTTRICGTLGELHCNVQTITHYDFLTGTREVIDINKLAVGQVGGHGGGDTGMMSEFIQAVIKHDESLIVTNCDATWSSHRTVFAAERARIEHQIIPVIAE